MPRCVSQVVTSNQEENQFDSKGKDQYYYFSEYSVPNAIPGTQ